MGKIYYTAVNRRVRKNAFRLRAGAACAQLNYAKTKSRFKRRSSRDIIPNNIIHIIKAIIIIKITPNANRWRWTR